MENRICQECSEPLRGRADQKFCTDACRNAYNNRKLGDTTSYMRKINRILKRNHAILEELNQNGKATIHKNILLKEGFNFTYFTHSYKTRKGKDYYFIYDQGFSEIENSKYILVKRED
jgi:hypothetical protein